VYVIFSDVQEKRGRKSRPLLNKQWVSTKKLIKKNILHLNFAYIREDGLGQKLVVCRRGAIKNICP